MLDVTSNIEKNERTTHIVIGAILLLGLILGFGKILLTLFSLLLIGEGVVGWSWIPIVMEKLGLNK